MLTLTTVILAGYLLGSLPFSLLAGRRAGIDIRDHGSGNAGATNVWRTLGWKPALVVLGLDVAKGALAAWIGGHWVIDAPAVAPAWLPAIAAAAAVIGHLWPVWAGFRGGKGVATACGGALVLAPVAAILSLAVFAGVVFVSRRVALGSMLASAAFPIALPLVQPVTPESAPALSFAAGFAVLVIWAHRTNVRRLIAGTEPKL